MAFAGGAGTSLPPVALLLVQLELVLVDIELFNEGVPVGIAQVLVCVVQKELIVQLFLPPSQLAAGGVEFLFTFLEGGQQPHRDPVGLCVFTAGGRGAGGRSFATGIIPKKAGPILTKNEMHNYLFLWKQAV